MGPVADILCYSVRSDCIGDTENKKVGMGKK